MSEDEYQQLVERVRLFDLADGTTTEPSKYMTASKGERLKGVL